jgi:uncharacterized membrane protein YphA (DoxX/SURF4 family)
MASGLGIAGVRDRPEAVAVLALRLCLGYFLGVWGVSKLVMVGQTLALFDYFYGIRLGAAVAYFLGIGEIAVAVGILLGLWRRLSYGAGLLIHATTFFVTAGFWARPLVLQDGVPINRLYVAGVPVLAAFVALYLLRRHDAWSLDAWLARRRLAAASIRT